MTKKLGDFTLAEIKRICAKQSTCQHCPFRREYSYGNNLALVGYLCALQEMMDSLDAIDVSKEVEIEEENI